MSNPTVQEQVMARATKDEAFRQRIAADPRAVLSSEYNVHIPESVNVRVIEDSANTVSIVLPAAEDAVQDLSDEELEEIAGGTWREFTWTLVCWGDGKAPHAPS